MDDLDIGNIYGSIVYLETVTSISMLWLQKDLP